MAKRAGGAEGAEGTEERLPARVSARKLAANRANALRSTGPQTEEGKEKASLNALKHGLLVGSARRLLTAASPEEREEYTQIIHLLYLELEPEGALEMMLVERVAFGFLRQMRAQRIETNALAAGPAFTSSQSGPTPVTKREDLPSAVEQLLRYEAHVERSISRALTELRRLRSQRAQRTEAEVLETVARLLEE